MGTKDYIKSILQELGATILFGRVKMKPGLPTTFATFNHGQKAYFGLPGNPVSCVTTFHCLVAPLILQSIGAHQIKYREEMAICEEDLFCGDREEFIRVRVEKNSQGKLIAKINGAQQSSRILSYAQADGLLRLPDHSKREKVDKDSYVSVIIFPTTLLS